jgi:hypothetical protein
MVAKRETLFQIQLHNYNNAIASVLDLSYHSLDARLGGRNSGSWDEKYVRHKGRFNNWRRHLEI